MNKRGPKVRVIAYRAVLGMILLASPLQAQTVRVYPAPGGEPLSPDFKVTVEQTNVPVYLARVVSISPEQRRTFKGAGMSQTAMTSFASFDMQGEVKVSVTWKEDVKAVKLLPASAGINPKFFGKTITFTVTKLGKLTLEVNGDWISSLNLFADPMETNVPDPQDPNVIYFGPGIHKVQSITVPSGKTVYIAGGAIIYGQSGEGRSDAAIFDLEGSNIAVRGRGIIDGSLCASHTRSILFVFGKNISVEGVVIRDSSTWTLPVRQSDQVKIDNVKILGWRGNSDGIDICNSRQVEVSDCFLRTCDDLIVLKTDKARGELKDVTVKNCVLWNEFAHALCLGPELRESLSNVLFSDCDVIHDKGREWLLRVYDCDSASVKNVVFDNIRIEEAQRLMSLWIGKSYWSIEPERGHIDDVVFKNVTSVLPQRPDPFADLIGFDPDHMINHVQFQDVLVGGQVLKESGVHQNAFVSGVTITP